MKTLGYTYKNKHNSSRYSIIQIAVYVIIVFTLVWVAARFFSTEMKWFFELPLNNFSFKVPNSEIRFPLLLCIALSVLFSFFPVSIESKCFKILPLDFCFPIWKSNLYLLIGTPMLFIIALYLFTDFKVVILPTLYLSLLSRGK